MANLQTITFGIHGQRIESLYDWHKLKPGAIVYVRFSEGQEPAAFSPQWSQEAVEYGVTRISKSEWYVEIVPQFKLRPNFAQRVQDEIGGYISRAEIDAALDKFVSMVRMDRFYQTDHLRKNPLSVVFTILERLNVCRRLRQSPPFPAQMLPYLDDPLVSYLYLTCFDRLGQSANYLPFGDWLRSSKRKDERKSVLQKASQTGNLEEVIRKVHDQYNKLYGVKSSFLRFVREILPPDVRSKLLDSIERVKVTNQPDLVRSEANDQEKETYLFDRRNNYTHEADFRPPSGEWFGGGMASPVQEFHATYWTSTRTYDWPNILEKAVRAGLAGYIRAKAEGGKVTST